MANKYIVQRYPMNHPIDGMIPVGEEVDLSHLTENEIQVKIDRRQIRLVKGRKKAAPIEDSKESED